MALYPQSSDMEQLFTMFRIAIFPIRWHVHPLPEIESWDTESLLDVEDGYCCFRVAPSVPVWDEVHKGNPCVSIVDKAAFRKGEAAIMVARKADNSEGFVSFHRYVDNLLQCPTVRRARLRDREVL